MECDAYHDFLWDGGWFGLFGGETTLPLPSFTFLGRIQAYSTCTHLGMVGAVGVVVVVWCWVDGGKAEPYFPPPPKMATLVTNKQAHASNEVKHMEHELKITRQLMESCGAGDVAQIKSTLAQCNDAPSRIQKARDANGKTLLHFAAATGQIPVVKYLMGVMAQDQSKLHQVVNAVDNDGSTPSPMPVGRHRTTPW